MSTFLGIKQIHELLRLTQVNPKDHALFHIAFSTGLRISDLLSIKRSNLMDTDGEVARALRIKMKKTKQWINRPLRKDCREAVEIYLSMRHDDNPYMFPPDQLRTRYGTNRKKPMNRMTAHRRYKKYLRMILPESMLVGSATHTPRRSMGKIISDRAGRIEPASKYLGHTSIASTQAYIDMNRFEEVANDIVMEIDL